MRPRAFRGRPMAPSRERTEMMQMHGLKGVRGGGRGCFDYLRGMTVPTLGLGGVRRAGERWPGSRPSSSPIPGSQQGISLVSNAACAMLLSLLPAANVTRHTSSSQKPGQEFALTRNQRCSVTLQSPRRQDGWATPAQSHKRHQPSAASTPKHALPGTHAQADGQGHPPLQGQRKTLNSSPCS